MPTAAIKVRPLRRDDWPQVVALFGARGACGGCWCMFWRRPRGGAAWERSKGAANRRALKRLIAAGKVTALLAFAGREPVGWCSLGPRSDFPKLAHAPSLAVDAPPGAWVVNCFYLRPDQRGRGLGTRLLAAAQALAERKGASVLDGFPAKAPRTGRLAHAFAWTGVPAMFEANGFERVARPGQARPVFRRRCRRASARR
jgi:GNAT superfamily N-acetyltransferase